MPKVTGADITDEQCRESGAAPATIKVAHDGATYLRASVVRDARRRCAAAWNAKHDQRNAKHDQRKDK